MKVRVGDKIRHYLFGGEVLTGKVEEIKFAVKVRNQVVQSIPVT